jgi:Tol biopolymer transport system component
MRPSRGGLGAIGAGLALAIGSGTNLAAEAGTRGAKTTRVSVSSHEGQANHPSHSPAISASGRFVVFESGASNLIRRDTNGDTDVFIRDRKKGITRRVSGNATGDQPNRASRSPAISANGRFVAFESGATNLVGGDTNGKLDVFVRDLRTGRTRRVSVSSAGKQGNRRSRSPSISASGRFVAYSSTATNLVAGDPTKPGGILVHDRRTGRTERVSVSSNGRPASGFSPAISASGRFVAFTSAAYRLIPGDTHPCCADVFVHDRRTAETTRVSEWGNKPSGEPAISADGRFIAFSSQARSLVAGDTNGTVDSFVHDQRTGETTRVSVSSTGAQAQGGGSKSPSISAHGRFVAFASKAINLVSPDFNGRPDIYLHDRKAGETERVSVSSAGRQGNESGRPPVISADGRFVAFASRAANLVRRDTNRGHDIFVRGPLR